jgi:MFS transporter, ACS family, hexuronate transporter
MADFGSLAGGWLPGRLMARGWPPAQARWWAMAACVIWMPLSAFAVFAPDIVTCVLLVSLGTMGHQGWSANLFTTVSDAFPGRSVATVVGLGQCLASFAGLLFSSLLPGYLIPLFGYAPIFLLLGTFHWIALAAVRFLIMPNARPET